MDPITFSIIRHRLFRIVDEAVITLKHVSGSAITNEGHDLMVSLYRADGSLVRTLPEREVWLYLMNIDLDPAGTGREENGRYRWFILRAELVGSE